MLTLLGFGMVITFMTLIMLKRLSPVVALIAIPIIFALFGGFGSDIGEMMLKGIKKIAPTGVMLMFAILYFGVMIDAGLFDPLVNRVQRMVKGDPLKILVGTAVLAMTAGLDGEGTTTYMISVSAMLSLCRRFQISTIKMAGVIILASGVMNISPWAGPMARAATALNVDTAEVFMPMIPAMLAGMLGVVMVAWVLGMGERRRLGYRRDQPLIPSPDEDDADPVLPKVEVADDLRRPRLMLVNLLLTIGLLTALVVNMLPLPVLFMIAFALAITINYPNMLLQRQRIAHYAGNALSVVVVVFAAGIFTGILSGTGMVKAMAGSLLAIIPDSMGPHLAVITSIISIPLTFFVSNDAFYFGILPVLSHTAAQYGITPLEMARASLVGQPVHLLSPLVPSTYLLVGMAGIDFGDFQRFALKWALLMCLALLSASLLLGIVPL
ncbi:CitMHS family transporter [Dyella silvatica]|uniref:CitMHS family transporter n=1 Tax=Dyella silvatica TaxID=2992128 RepID=UPI0022526FB9|nr:CitMHS family transporter [Dyella silvatica]